jgi:2-aminoadipate transaminase
MRTAAERVLTESPQAALQYSATEGFAPLREWIAKRYSRDGLTLAPENVLITTGSQQGLDLIGKIFIDEGSRVLVEAPSYLGALQSFSLFAPTYVPVPTVEHGLLPEALTPEQTKGARFLYAMPNFQNPTGRRLPMARREALAAVAKRDGLAIIEDDPYGELDYEGQRLPSLMSLAPEHVLYMGSFSKVLAPGLRLGFIIGPQAVIAKLVQAKQAADLHTPSLTQRIAYEVVKDGFLDTHIPSIRTLYAAQANAMLASLAKHMPTGTTWTPPAGGMFIWLTLPAGIDTMLLLEKAIAQNVAFVPGAPFYVGTPPANTLRLSFVTVPPEKIEVGVARLGALVAEALARRAA